MERPPVGGWTAFPPLIHPRFDPWYGGPSSGLRLRVLVLSDGRVLVRGGHVVNIELAKKKGGAHWHGVPVKESEIWDGRGWREIPAKMAEELAEGGRESSTSRTLAWRKDSNSGWDAERRGAALLPLGDGDVLVAGGALIWSTWDGDDSEDCVTTTVLATKSEWHWAGDITKGRMRGAGVRMHDGRVMFVGGQDTGYNSFANVDVWESMVPDRAVAAWARTAIERALVENGKYPLSLEQDLSRARDRVLSWGAEYGATFVDELRVAVPSTDKAAAVLQKLLKGAQTS